MSSFNLTLSRAKISAKLIVKYFDFSFLTNLVLRRIRLSKVKENKCSKYFVQDTSHQGVFVFKPLAWGMVRFAMQIMKTMT